ncbi:MAG: hypothetical protein Q7U94_06315 [Sideroxyarcus sp.]|nr:hypothetical protein [Sideroxyarcus sp.]
MKDQKYKLEDLVAQCDAKAVAPADDECVQDAKCDHDWQPDGQTMTAVRFSCTKCHKSKLSGLDI